MTKAAASCSTAGIAAVAPAVAAPLEMAPVGIDVAVARNVPVATEVEGGSTVSLALPELSEVSLGPAQVG